MQWEQIRALYAQLFRAAKARGETQTTIAQRGGLAQNQISDLLRNADYGPTVEIFVRAVAGLGISLSAFFTALEQRDAVRLQDEIAAREADATERLQKVERSLRHALAVIHRQPPR